MRLKKLVNFNPKGRYSDDSTIEHLNDLDELRWGELEHDGEVWTQEEADLLLESYLVSELSMVGKNSLVTTTRRKRKGVETKLQKFGIAHGDPEKGYCPIARSDRTGNLLTKREVYLIQLATRPRGRRERAHYPDYLARILVRSVLDVKRILNTLANEHQGFGIEEQPRRGETEEDRLAQKIAHNLRNWHSDWGRGIFNLKGVGIIDPTASSVKRRL